LRLALLILPIIIVFALPLSGQINSLEVGEELVYNVYYGFIKLGEVKFNITGRDSIIRNRYFSKAELRSFEGIPFMEVNFIFESEFDYDSKMQYHNNCVYSVEFNSSEFKKDEMNKRSIFNINYNFIYDSSLIFVKKLQNNNITEESKINIKKNVRYQDGLSIFYNARLQSLSTKNNFNIPVYINEKESSVKYSFNKNIEDVSIDLVNYDVAVIKIEGRADFTGVVGLTGEFAGWLSNDNQRIPIKALFNVAIGSVKLELASYKRKNWKPPVFKN